MIELRSWTRSMALAGALLSMAWPCLAQDVDTPERLERHEFTEVHMAVRVRVALYAPEAERAREGARAAFDRIAELEALLSDYRASSEIRRLERGEGREAGRASGVEAGWVPVSPELAAVLGQALELARLSDGAFDPTAKPVVDLWREARTKGAPPSAAALDSARALVDWRVVELDSLLPAVHFARPGVRLDLGAIAKGFILDEAFEVLRSRGLDRVMVEAGGDIRVGSPPPGREGWKILAPNADSAVTRRAAALAHAALATSAPTAQHLVHDGVRYSHVVDPRTGRALTNDRVATVVAPTAAIADGLATTLTILGADAGRRLLGAFPEAVASVRVEGLRGGGTP